MGTEESRRALWEDLELALLNRNVIEGFDLLDKALRAGLQLEGSEAYSYDLLLALAQWVDLGYRDANWLEVYAVRLSQLESRRMTLYQFVRLRLAQGFLELAKQNFLNATSLFDGLLSLAGRALEPQTRFLLHFWRGRANRKLGRFDESLSDFETAKRYAQDQAATKLVAVATIHESWLVFHKGDRRRAFVLLEEAEEVLSTTSHTLSLANIAAARGRFVRHTGDYARSLAHFERAIELYRAQYPQHPNLARALVNAAYVKRLMARELQPARGALAAASIHARALRVVEEAVLLLREAGQIYSQHQHQAGSGSVLINLGHLKLDIGDIEGAATEASGAYALGSEKEDRVLTARARILQAYVEMECSQEQIEQNAAGVPSRIRAIEFAEEAIRLAESTENRRLLAGAYITRGLAATDDKVSEFDTARQYAARAQALLGNDDHDHLSRELDELKRKTGRLQDVEDLLRRWANGELGSKSFQQVEEEFAELVIPRVWENLGRNVSRVAEQLSISPKKVRRALRNTRNHPGSTAP